MTSPVDFISGPSIGSAPGNFIKGNTASLTEKYDGNEYFGYPMSLSFFPTMTSAAILARGMPVATGIPLAKIAAEVMVGKKLKDMGYPKYSFPSYFSVKEAVFPFIKFPGADPILGPEMKSTGEVMVQEDLLVRLMPKLS